MSLLVQHLIDAMLKIGGWRGERMCVQGGKEKVKERDGTGEKERVREEKERTIDIEREGGRERGVGEGREL